VVSELSRRITLALFLLASPSVALARPEACGEVQREIDRLASAAEPEVLMDLAPHFSPAALDELLRVARTGPAPLAHGAYMALGLSRLAAGLKRLRAEPPPPADRRLSWSLAMLALGDGTGTGTITAALVRGPLEQRRMVAHALALMPQKRPRTILYEALVDEDPQVRLTAAEVHVRFWSHRARRVLIEMMSDRDPVLAERAALALYEQDHRFRPEELAGLPEGVAAPALVANAVKRVRVARSVKSQLMHTKRIVRSSALAALVALGAMDAPREVQAWARRARPRFGNEVDGQAAMAIALKNAVGVEGLLKLEAGAVPSAAQVLWAFAGAGAPYNQLDPEHARSLESAVESWVAQGLLDDRAQSRVLEAMAATDPLAGLALARSRAVGPEGGALLTALAIIERIGGSADVQVLSTVAKKTTNPRTRAAAWRAGSEVCRR
jgi:HEAT repeat protein